MKALQDEGLDVEFHRLDVTSCRSIRACVAAVAERRGRIDVLVNNAGVLIDPRGSRFLDSKLDTYRDTLETNLFGPLQLAQAVVPLMKANRYGRIVNVSSGLGQLSEMGAGTPAYRISKTALNALTRHPCRRVQGEQYPRELDVPGLGAHAHGRRRRAAHPGGGCRHRRVARDPAR